MAHQILMLGGFRAGKSSILASILYALKENTGGDIFTVIDQTDYTAAERAAVRLEDKRLEIKKYLKNRNKVVAEDSKFLVDMNPTQDYNEYKLTTRIDGAANVDFQFVDVAGEYMEETHQKYNDLKKWVSGSDVFIVAIDTPYMMETDEDTNRVYNRIEEITKVLSTICGNIEDPESEKKLVIFCPVKCETWVRPKKLFVDIEKRHEHAEEVTNKVKQSYKTLINILVKSKGVDLWVMPIQTVGALEFVETTDAYKYYKDDNDAAGVRCSYDELTGIVRLENGKTLMGVDENQVEKNTDSTRNNGLIDIPYAWYKVNDQKEYAPVFCEQPAYHIIRFLVNKELMVNKRKKQEIEQSPWYKRLYSWFVDPPFGKYIENYKRAVDLLESNNKIKESGDGFTKLTQTIS